MCLFRCLRDSSGSAELFLQALRGGAHQIVAMPLRSEYGRLGCAVFDRAVEV